MTRIADQSLAKRKIPTLFRIVQGVLMLIAAFLMTAHAMKFDLVRVDWITLALLGLLLVIPFADNIRKIKMGQFEAEIAKEEVAKIQAKASTELASGAEQIPLELSEKDIRMLVRDDSPLAMAKVRIEIEKAIRRLHTASDLSARDSRPRSLGRMVDELMNAEIISGPVAGALRDVIRLANRAVHGERVESSTAEDLATLGVRLVSEINHIYQEHILKPVESVVITGTKVDTYHEANYKVTTIVPLVEKPTQNVYILSQEDFDSFLEGYNEHAEFIIEVERLQT